MMALVRFSSAVQSGCIAAAQCTPATYLLPGRADPDSYTCMQRLVCVQHAQALVWHWTNACCWEACTAWYRTSRYGHLQEGFPGARTLAEDLNDKANPIQHGHAPCRLQVALLHAAQDGVHKHPACKKQPQGCWCDHAADSHCSQLEYVLTHCAWGMHSMHACHMHGERGDRRLHALLSMLGRESAPELGDSSRPEVGAWRGREALRRPDRDAAAPAARIGLCQPQCLLPTACTRDSSG